MAGAGLEGGSKAAREMTKTEAQSISKKQRCNKLDAVPNWRLLPGGPRALQKARGMNGGAGELCPLDGRGQSHPDLLPMATQASTPRGGQLC